VGIRWVTKDAQATPQGHLLIFGTGDCTAPVRSMY
jgi:hypothetical protein